MGAGETRHYAWRASRIAYTCRGNGRKLLVCLHGYGEAGHSFECLESIVNQDFTILTLDLPFHGGTEWKEGLKLEPRELWEIIGGIAGEAGCGGIRQADRAAGAGPGQPGCTLFGYSMGGRLAISLFACAPERVDKLVLAAPDGLVVNSWYRLVTQVGFGNRLFKWFMRHWRPLYYLLEAARWLGLLNKSLYTFTVNYVHDGHDRDLLYKRWTTLRSFHLAQAAFRRLVRSREVPVRLVYGKQDRIIRAKVGERFCREIEPFGKLVELDCGHRVLQEKYAAVFMRLLED